MWSFVLDRLASLNARATAECREPTCGARAMTEEEGEIGEVISCSSPNCGEKLMLPGWRRELQVMRDFQALIEGLERKEMAKEMAKQAAADKESRKR